MASAIPDEPEIGKNHLLSQSVTDVDIDYWQGLPDTPAADVQRSMQPGTAEETGRMAGTVA